MITETVLGILALIGGYLFYRLRELIDLGEEIVIAYDDHTVTEEEYKRIVDRLRLVLFKK